MTQPTPARVRHCPDCDGFAVAAIDTGTRHLDGTRATLRITCPACQGTGTAVRRARRTAPVGR